MTDSSLDRTLAALPEHLRREVADFADFLLSKYSKSSDQLGEEHPLADLAGAWKDEELSDDELLPKRSAGRDIDF